MRTPRNFTGQAALGGLAVLTGYTAVVGGGIIKARRAIGTSDARPPSPDGVYGDDLPGTPVRLLVLGDSAAVGYGMTRADDTTSAQTALGLAEILDRPVEVRCVAVVGAQTSDLREQLDASEDFDADLALLIVGVNDVTHHVPGYQSSRHLGATVRRLTDRGTRVVVGTCPDLGTVRPIPQPLRSMARRRSRALARRQTIAVVRSGGRAVSLGGLLGILFAEKYDVMFGEDRFHPSATGYANVVSVLIPSLAAAWRERDRDDLLAAHYGGAPGQMSLTDAAEQAGLREGTEVTRDGRWARILRRR